MTCRKFRSPAAMPIMMFMMMPAIIGMPMDRGVRFRG